MKKFAIVASLLVALVAGAAQAGSTTGAGVYREIAPAYGTKTIVERYFGGETAVLQFIGDGDTDLDIFVYDHLGNLIVSGVGLTDREMVAFRPHYTSNFTIVIQNRGSIFNRFTLRTN